MCPFILGKHCFKQPSLIQVSKSISFVREYKSFCVNGVFTLLYERLYMEWRA